MKKYTVGNIGQIARKLSLRTLPRVTSTSLSNLSKQTTNGDNSGGNRKNINPLTTLPIAAAAATIALTTEPKEVSTAKALPVWLQELNKFDDNGEYVKAFNHLFKLSQENPNDKEVHFNLAQRYEKGRGVARSKEEAIKSYLIAADAGHIMAQTYLGMLYEQEAKLAKERGESDKEKEKYAEAIKYQEKAASAGNLEAIQRLGFLYRNPDNQIKGITDYKKAKEYYDRIPSSSEYYADAQYWIGEMYNSGVYGLDKDETKALKHIERAANYSTPYTEARIYMAGHYYKQGNKEKCKQYLESAEKQIRELANGKYQAAYNVGNYFLTEVEKNKMEDIFTPQMKKDMLRYLAVSAQHLSKFKEAREYAKELEKCDPTNNTYKQLSSYLDREIEEEEKKKDLKESSKEKKMKPQKSYPSAKEYAILADCVYRVDNLVNSTTSNISSASLEGHNIYSVHNKDNKNLEQKNQVPSIETFESKQNQFRQDFAKKPEIGMENWRILKTTSDYDLSQKGYFAVAFQNIKTGNIVISHKGTTDPDDAVADYYIAGNQEPNQYKYAREFVQKITELNKKEVISHTGHSLGAFLAEVSACEYNNKAVTFESPGSKIVIEKLYATHENKRNLGEGIELAPDIEYSDITTFVGEPNIVNCAKEHLGRMFRMYKDFLSHKEMKIDGKLIDEQLKNWSGKNVFASMALKVGLSGGDWKKIINGSAGHSMDEYLEKNESIKKILNFIVDFGEATLAHHTIATMISTFDPDSGMPRVCNEVSQWPIGSDKYFVYRELMKSLSEYDPNLVPEETLTKVQKLDLNNIQYVANEYNEKTIALSSFPKYLQSKIIKRDFDEKYDPELVQGYTFSTHQDSKGQPQTIVIPSKGVSPTDFFNHITYVAADERRRERNMQSTKTRVTVLQVTNLFAASKGYEGPEKG